MSDYTEHLISMAGGDGDPLDQIQRRLPKIPESEMSQAERDRAYLLALVREQQERLDELRALADVADLNDQQFGDGNGGSLTTEAIRAALTETEGV